MKKYLIWGPVAIVGLALVGLFQNMSPVSPAQAPVDDEISLSQGAQDDQPDQQDKDAAVNEHILVFTKNGSDNVQISVESKIGKIPNSFDVSWEITLPDGTKVHRFVFPVNKYYKTAIALQEQGYTYSAALSSGGFDGHGNVLSSAKTGGYCDPVSNQCVSNAKH